MHDLVGANVMVLGLLCAAACMFSGTILGFICNELIQKRVSSSLIRFAETAAVAIVLLGIGVAFVSVMLGMGKLWI